MQNATENTIDCFICPSENVKHKVNIWQAIEWRFVNGKETCKMRLAYGVDAQLHCVPRPWMAVKMNLNVFIDVESGKWNNKIKQRKFRAEAIVKWEKGWGKTREQAPSNTKKMKRRSKNKYTQTGMATSTEMKLTTKLNRINFTQNLITSYEVRSCMARWTR